MSNWNTFLKSVPAGVMIGLGVTAFISSENKVFGSILLYSVQFCSAWDFLVYVLLGLIFLQAKSAMLFLQKIIRIAL